MVEKYELKTLAIFRIFNIPIVKFYFSDIWFIFYLFMACLITFHVFFMSCLYCSNWIA